MKKGLIYNCKYLSGGGIWYNEGDFEIISNTKKSIKIKRLNGEGSGYIPDEQIIKKKYLFYKN